MLLADDELTIQRQLGVSEIPQEVIDEYEHWIVRHHKGGGSGPLGHYLINALLGKLNCNPAKAGRAQEVIEWRNLKVGSPVMVTMCSEAGKEDVRRGEFKGVVDFGTLAVLIHGESYVREVAKHRVEIYHPPIRPEVNAEEEDLGSPGVIDWSAIKDGELLYFKGQETKYVKDKGDRVTVNLDGRQMTVDKSLVSLRS